MTREIKFRAWDEEQKFMLQLGDLKSIEYVGRTGSRMWEQFELMQYTGLKDKNGKEIYEGDICKDKAGHTDSIKFEHSRWAWWVEDCLQCYLQVPEMAFEIIGNIYENPELIK